MPLVYDWKILWNQCEFLYESVVVKMSNNLINICGGHTLAVCRALEHTLDKDNVARKDKLLQMLIDLELMCQVYPRTARERSIGGQRNSLEDAQFLEQREQVRLSSQKMTFPVESFEEDFTYYQYKSGQEGRLKHSCLQTNM